MPPNRVLVTPLGIISLEDDERIVAYRLFKDLDEAISKYSKLSRGELLEDLVELIKELSSKGFREFEIDPPHLLGSLLNLFPGYKFSELSTSVDIEKILVDSRLVEDVQEYRDRLRRVSDAILTVELKKAVARRDMMIVHAVHVLEDLDKQINMFYTRCREWYGLHFPELSELIEDPEEYMRIIAELGSRSGFDLERLSKIVGEKKAKEIIEKSLSSIGADLSLEDEEQLKKIAREGLRLIEMKKHQEAYIRDLMSSEAPNLSAVVGAILGAKLISLAGGLDKLARFPASTIQVLGAEKALFRFFKTGRGAPKHGIIFQHLYVHSSPKWQRGKIARLLATKIAIAAKIDYFSREDRSGELRKTLEERLEEIRKKYSQPPVKKKVKPEKTLKRKIREHRR
ncbi:MAG: hypothetical protein ABDH32_07310 [Candidatus Caldarchaeales archaeon]